MYRIYDVQLHVFVAQLHAPGSCPVALVALRGLVSDTSLFNARRLNV